MTKNTRRIPWRRTLKRSFFSGLLVVVPVAVTVYILLVLFRAADNILQPLLTATFQRYIPGLGILATLALVFVVGLVTRNLVAQRLLRLGDRTLAQVPLAGTIYGAIKQILSSFAREEEERPQQVVLVPYPSAGLWAFGFLNREVTLEDGRRMGLVLILNSINPTTGLLTMLPADAIQRVDLSVEQAMKLIISGGLVAPARLTTQPLE
jgi:uncharacterized membrane protein